jgi:hypothetical protein
MMTLKIGMILVIGRKILVSLILEASPLCVLLRIPIHGIYLALTAESLTG